MNPDRLQAPHLRTDSYPTARVKESDEIRPGVIADFGYDGGVVGFEILQASKVVEQAGEWSSRDASDIDR